ncbi:hypothetical protein K523DRAFT_322684 [Schizophyllum commune Tattone D]|nr:hypothetical protein K523DRAFT_322684 [Schizophyllum commune Tattone D]
MGGHQKPAETHRQFGARAGQRGTVRCAFRLGGQFTGGAISDASSDGLLAPLGLVGWRVSSVALASLSGVSWEEAALTTT